jgi:hypothetical protein
VADGAYGEIIVSTLPRRTSPWLRNDLPRRIERLGVPVAVVTPDERRKRVTVETGVHESALAMDGPRPTTMGGRP